VLPMNVLVLVVDGVVKLPPEANGAVVVGGSNVTVYAAYFSAKAGARAAVGLSHPDGMRAHGDSMSGRPDGPLR
jgi:hypothetical protein